MNPRLALLAVAFALAVTGATGCERSTSPTFASNPFWMRVLTAEGDATRHLLSVGDTGFAELSAAKPGCTCDFCFCVEDAYGAFHSSDTNVVALQYLDSTDAMGRTRLGHSVQFLGKAPGSVQLSYSSLFTFTLEPWRDSVRVDVVAARLPVDSLRVRLDPSTNTYAVAAVTDAAGNLVSVTLPVGSYVTVRSLAFRGGDPAVYLPGTVASSDTSVAPVAPISPYWAGTFPWGRRVGWSSVREGQTATVLGSSSGTATVTVTARSQGYSFPVTVQ